MDLNTAWYLLIGVLLVGYALLDGFDLGVGVLHLFARDERERRISINAIGPVWDGNEVWLLAFGGAVFATFPPVYATVASSFYLAVMLFVFALIFRAVALEFRRQVDNDRWRKVWDGSFAGGSLLAAIIFGVATGNILRGLPIDADGAVNISFLALLNPYALLVGLLSLALFTMHGAAFLALITEGGLQQRMTKCMTGAWLGLVVLGLVATAATGFVSPFLLQGLAGKPLSWIIGALLLAAIVYLPIAARRGRALHAFAASAVTIGALISLTGISLFPRMVPSSLDLSNSLTIYNASSSGLTLKVALLVTLIAMPVVLIYTAYIYKVFMGKLQLPDDSY